MKFPTIFILFFSALLVSCNGDNSQQTATESNTRLSGILHGGNGMMLLLEKRSTAIDSEPIDSIALGEDGSFDFNFTVSSLGFYRLSLSNANAINLVLRPGEQVRIETEAENMAANYTVEGSPGSSKLRELTGFMLENYTKIDSLKNAMRQHQSLGDYNAYTAAATKASILQARLAKFVMDFIDANPKSLASLVAVGVLNPDDHYAYFKKVVDSLADVVPEQAFYTLLRDKVKQWSVLAPGATAPDITLKDVLGSPRSLSSFRGDVVLLDFWASWCRPCRMQNPQLVKLHNKYGKQGFTIFSVSLDGMPQQKDPESDWKRAIQQDGLAWPNHVSDLQGWSSAVVPLYRIEGIPMTILLDKEGIIVAKNLHGQLLEDKIKSLLGVE